MRIEICLVASLILAGCSGTASQLAYNLTDITVPFLIPWSDSRESNATVYQTLCKENRQRLVQTRSYEEEGLWSTRHPRQDPLTERLAIETSEDFLTELLDSDSKRAAQKKISKLYLVEYCAGNNPYVDIYEQQSGRLAAVSAGAYSIYDCRNTEFAKKIIDDLIAEEYWSGLQTTSLETYGNTHLKVNELPKFGWVFDPKTTEKEKETYWAARTPYYAAAVLVGVCSGSHVKLYFGPDSELGLNVEMPPRTVQEHIGKIGGLPEW